MKKLYLIFLRNLEFETLVMQEWYYIKITIRDIVKARPDSMV